MIDDLPFVTYQKKKFPNENSNIQMNIKSIELP